MNYDDRAVNGADNIVREKEHSTEYYKGWINGFLTGMCIVTILLALIAVLSLIL